MFEGLIAFSSRIKSSHDVHPRQTRLSHSHAVRLAICKFLSRCVCLDQCPLCLRLSSFRFSTSFRFFFVRSPTEFPWRWTSTSMPVHHSFVCQTVCSFSSRLWTRSNRRGFRMGPTGGLNVEWEWSDSSLTVAIIDLIAACNDQASASYLVLILFYLQNFSISKFQVNLNKESENRELISTAMRCSRYDS